MSGDYGSHKEYLYWVESNADKRKKLIEGTLKLAFKDYIEKREVDVILFSTIEAEDLGQIIFQHPAILKPILATCNLAGRAIERDLKIRNLNTYLPKIDRNTSLILAGYIKPFLPECLELGALSQIDRIYFIDKEIRKTKGNWEKEITLALNKVGNKQFKKRKFTYGGEVFEIDAASPGSGVIEIAVDVKRIEARRDLQTKCDEIENKAKKLKLIFSNSFFGVMIYYPFSSEHVNINNRLNSKYIDAIQFAGSSQESIESAVMFMLSMSDEYKKSLHRNPRTSSKI